MLHERDLVLAKNTEKKRSEPKFLAVDFFCGAGGTTRGLIDAGGYLVAGIDKDTQCEASFVKNNSNESVDCRPPRFLNLDIFPCSKKCPEGQQEILIERLENLVAHYKKTCPRAPLLFAICAPCQPFTNLSKKALTAERQEARRRDSNLLEEAAKFVERFRPELILSENVAGIDDPRHGGIWDKFKDALSELGYAVGSEVVCASEFGVPQRRKRSILLGIRKDRLPDPSTRELNVPESDPKARLVSVKEAIGHLPPIGAGEIHGRIPNHRTRNLSELNIRRLRSARPGESNAYLERTRYGDLSLNCHRNVNRRWGSRCFSDVYTRMHPDRPAPTITTKCHSISNGRFGHFDRKQNRGISLREAAILQSFPDNYVFYPTTRLTTVARMIGNAVPPKLAKFYSEYLANSIA